MSPWSDRLPRVSERARMLPVQEVVSAAVDRIAAGWLQPVVVEPSKLLLPAQDHST